MSRQQVAVAGVGTKINGCWGDGYQLECDIRETLPLGASWKTLKNQWLWYPKISKQFGTHLYRRCFEMWLWRGAWTRFCRTVASGSKEHSEYKGRCTFKGHGPFVALSLLHLSLTFDNLKNKQIQAGLSTAFPAPCRNSTWSPSLEKVSSLAPPIITTVQQCICLQPQRVPTNVYISNRMQLWLNGSSKQLYSSQLSCLQLMLAHTRSACLSYVCRKSLQSAVHTSFERPGIGRILCHGAERVWSSVDALPQCPLKGWFFSVFGRVHFYHFNSLQSVAVSPQVCTCSRH